MTHKYMDAGATENTGSVDNWVASLGTQETRQAVDTPGAAPTSVADFMSAGDDTGGSLQPEETTAPGTQPESVAEYIFKQQEDTGGTAEKKTAKGVSFDAFMKTRNILQGWLLAKLAKSDDRQKYMLGDDALDMLTEAYGPYVDTITGTVPVWVGVAMAEFATTGMMVLSALDDRRSNIAAEKIRRNNAKVQATGEANPQEVIINQFDKPRSDFRLNKKGYFYFDRNGDYVKKEDPHEYPDLNNIEVMKKVIDKNGWETTKLICEIDDSYLVKNNINLDAE